MATTREAPFCEACLPEAERVLGAFVAAKPDRSDMGMRVHVIIPALRMHKIHVSRMGVCRGCGCLAVGDTCSKPGCQKPQVDPVLEMLASD